jgi:glycolate oxidase FAD binding subunit
MNRISQLQDLVKSEKSLKISSKLLDYEGILQYFPEELVISVKAGTPIKIIQKALSEKGQILPFFITDDNQSIGAAFAIGAPDLSDSVLGVKIIDGRGEVLNFGGQVMKNVAGYDVSRLLVGSKGALAMVLEISFKVMPQSYVGELCRIKKIIPSSESHQKLEKKLKKVFDPKEIFQSCRR